MTVGIKHAIRWKLPKLKGNKRQRKKAAKRALINAFKKAAKRMKKDINQFFGHLVNQEQERKKEKI